MATDETEAKALGFNRDYIDIYSNSWGPDDRGFEVKGPGKATKEKLKEGAREVNIFLDYKRVSSSLCDIMTFYKEKRFLCQII